MRREPAKVLTGEGVLPVPPLKPTVGRSFEKENMRKSVFDIRFCTTVILLSLFLLCQLLFPVTSWAGALCVNSLQNPAESHSFYESSSYGLPLPFITVGQEGCFGSRRSFTEWYIPFLLIDVVVMCFIGALPYILPPLWRRIKHQRVQ